MRAAEAPLALASWTTSTGDASSLADPVLHSPGGESGFGAENTTGYADAEVDAMILRAATEMRSEIRGRLLVGLMRRALEDLPLIPLYSPGWTYGMREGLTFTPRLDLAVFASDVGTGHVAQSAPR